jgi:hypothetical protein
VGGHRQLVVVDDGCLGTCATAQVCWSTDQQLKDAMLRNCAISRSLLAVLTTTALFLPSLGWNAAGTAKPTLILNEDDSHFFGSRSAEQMNLEGLHAFVDQYAHTAVSHLFLCPNAMKASHRSKVRDAIWELKDGQKPPQEEFAKKWCENARLLDERGLDPYAG